MYLAEIALLWVVEYFVQILPDKRHIFSWKRCVLELCFFFLRAFGSLFLAADWNYDAGCQYRGVCKASKQHLFSHVVLPSAYQLTEESESTRVPSGKVAAASSRSGDENEGSELESGGIKIE